MLTFQGLPLNKSAGALLAFLLGVSVKGGLQASRKASFTETAVVSVSANDPIPLRMSWTVTDEMNKRRMALPWTLQSQVEGLDSEPGDATRAPQNSSTGEASSFPGS